MVQYLTRNAITYPCTQYLYIANKMLYLCLECSDDPIYIFVIVFVCNLTVNYMIGPYAFFSK